MSNRGRSNFQQRGWRGRSNSRGRGRGSQNFQPPPPPPMNYANQQLIQQTADEKAKVEARLEQNLQLAKAAETKPKPANKSQIIEDGKELVNKYFKGFQAIVRGDVKVTLDSSFINRVCEPYYEKIDHIVRDVNSDMTDPTQLETIQTEFCNKFVGAADIGVALKLYRSAPDDDKDRLFYYNALHNSQISLPKKVGIIINQVGKTDLKDDHRLRIVGQDLMAKRHLVRGVVRYYRDGVTGFMNNTTTTYKSLLENITTYGKFDGMIDRSSSSVIYIHENVQSLFNKLRDVELTLVDTNGDSCQMSLPPFDFNSATPDQVKKYLNNGLFKHFGITKNKPVYASAACVALSQLDLRWLKNPTSTLGAILGGTTGNTDMDGLTINELFSEIGFWDINSYFDDKELNELAIEVIHNWNVAYVPRLKPFIKMENLNFASYGSESQLIEVDENRMSRNNSSWKEYHRRYHNIGINILVGKANSWVKTKTSEAAAVLGSVVKFNQKVEYVSNFQVGIDGTNRAILKEFLSSDMI